MPDTDIPELPCPDGYRKSAGITITWVSFRSALYRFSSWPGLSRPSTSFLPASNKNVDARDKPGHDDADGNACSYDRVASTTPASVNTSATICVSPSGSPSAIADVTTPITGTAMVPIAATEAGSRASAANQLT